MKLSMMRAMKKLYVLILLCLAHQVYAGELPDLGDISQNTLSPQQERQIGQQSLQQLRNSKQLLDDAEVDEYLNQIGSRLAERSSEPALEFDFFAVNDYGVNAFAMPGGFIGVNAGLLLTTQSESELASVLSHEISHVTQHHLARMIAGQQGDSVATIAALALAILAARGNAQVTEAAVVGAQAGLVQRQLDFTRQNEEEADRIGLQLLQKSGFSVHAMPEFLERLRKATRLLDNNAPNYLRTHPITSERVAEIEDRVQNQPYQLIPDSLDFQLVRAKLIVAQKTAPEAIAYFDDALNGRKFGNPIVQRYGLVSALLRNNQAKLAARELVALRKQAKHNALIETLAGQVKRAVGNDAAALAFYRSAVQNFPQHRALIYDYADLLLQTRQPDVALKLLNDEVSRHPSDIRLYELQARAFGMQGKYLEQHQAQAYSYTWQGNIHAAIEQLELAKQAGGSFYQLSAIESELRELKGIMEKSGKTAAP
jgi:predicted Zn-dependent protease